MSSKPILLWISLALAVALAAFVWLRALPAPRDTVGGQARIGGPFTLVDTNGATVRNTDFRGKVMVVFFGFTFCPDVCPTALTQISRALELLGKDRGRVAAVFISVDPERDTPKKLATYMTNFPGVVGLTGSMEAVTNAASAYKVYFAKEGDPSSKSYTVNHSGFLYVMDKTGTYQAHLAHTADAEVIAEKIRHVLSTQE